MKYVSIVICTFNRSEYIRPCVSSLREQTYPKDRYEIIVVDDASTDETGKITAIEGATLIRHEANRGISAARNTGIAAAKGEIIAFIDDDAIADPHWLAYLVQPFADPGVTASGGRTFAYKTDRLAERYLSATEYGNPASLSFGRSKNPLWRFAVYIKSMFVPVSVASSPIEVQAVFGLNCAYRASTLRAIGGFDETLFTDEDSELSTRLRATGARIMFIPTATITHRHRESLAKLIRQTYLRAENTVRYYAKEKKVLPIFPFPLFYIAVALILMITAPVIGILFIVIGPLILYSWWTIRAFRTRNPEYLLYGYIQAALELSAILGMVRGQYRTLRS